MMDARWIAGLVEELQVEIQVEIHPPVETVLLMQEKNVMMGVIPTVRTSVVMGNVVTLKIAIAAA
jgi:hypothetical protein